MTDNNTTPDYRPQVGDIVRRSNWNDNDDPIEVTAVGRGHLLGIERGHSEQRYVLDGHWVKVEKPTPLPEVWINVYPTFVVDHSSRAQADKGADGSDRLALVHVRTDENGDDIVTIERTS